jgi:hypothetical protein
LAAETLPEKLTNEKLVFLNRAGDKPALGAQMGVVFLQNVGQCRSVTRQVSSWDYVLPAQMIEKLPHGFEVAPALSVLALEKCRHKRLIKVRNCGSVSFHPLPKIRN